MSLPTKPYLIRALYEWCGDNGYTPFVAVRVNQHTRVPRQFVKDDEIVLNISMNAVKNLLIDNEWLSFNARFGGVAQEVWVPIGHVASIFARETGEGMGFEIQEWQPENHATQSQSANTAAETAQPSSKKGLKLVK